MATHTTGSGRAGGEDGDGDEDGDEGDDLPAAVVEDLLAAEERRAMLAHLHERDAPVAVDDLAALLATGSVEGDVSTDRRRAARNEIYQDHLPKLTATGAVRFDSILGTVEFTGGSALTERLEEPGAEDK